MKKRFYSLRFPVFGTIAMLILCMVFFLLPFSLRGARLAIDTMQNNVADWLPGHFQETHDLEEFRKYFVGDQFVVVTGPWCKEGDATYTNVLRKIYEESAVYEDELTDKELIRAHQKGDELGLMYTGNYHEDWGQSREKWLKGANDQWYFIKRNGQLYRWDGQNNVIEGLKRSSERMFTGKNLAHGTYIDKFGPPPDDEKGIPNPFYADPQKLCARPFKSVSSGPQVFEKMAGKDGTLRYGKFSEEDEATFQARMEAHKRLTGALFGPTPNESFRWTFDSLLQQVEETNDKSLLTQLQSLPIHRQQFEEFIQFEVENSYEGDFNKLVEANRNEKLELWYRMWEKALGMEAPARQTCLIVTLNQPVINELDRAVGRPLLGKARGRILEIATGECGIDASNLHIGGPPADNVAIDEEGTSTLLRLVSLSVLIGVTLAWFSFKSIRITVMLFFVGGVAAISSLSFVWFCGFTMDAILMSMPSLVFVLGLSGAVHVVNYYRDACHEDGDDLAAETAVKHGLFPCALAAFTTSLGLISLYASSLTPIKKFGLFSAIAVLATVFLLFTYLPAALTIWKPGFKKRSREELERDTGLAATVAAIWRRIGEWVLVHYKVVMITCLFAMVFFAYGISRVKTSVHLLKLFDSDAKILQDYRWIEDNLGKLVPAEVVIGIKPESQLEYYRNRLQEEADAKNAGMPAELDDEGNEIKPPLDYDSLVYDSKFTMLERMELSSRVRKNLEKFFGADGLDVIGRGMSTDVFVPLHRIESNFPGTERNTFNRRLGIKRQEMLDESYLAIDLLEALESNEPGPESDEGRELWRISIRLAALNDVDYGQFVNDLKAAVEPILNAYRFRTQILGSLYANKGEESLSEAKVLFLGRDPVTRGPEVEAALKGGFQEDVDHISHLVDQSYIFSNTLLDLMENRNFGSQAAKNVPLKNKRYFWLDPTKYAESNSDGSGKPFPSQEEWEKFIRDQDCIVLIEEDPLFDINFIKQHCANFIDAREHKFKINPVTNTPLPGMLTAMERQREGDDVAITATYTGIIPIVYKAQNQLLISLVNSIGLAFLMIAGVMMLLLRDWNRPVSIGNSVNLSGGALSMIPNVFPVVVVFGIMGHLGIKVDIGSMMTASVAMGVAVDDTIHFLNWYRKGLAAGLARFDAIRMAYERVATAMTQTTLIGGLGLFAFALSTFTPTQRFGVLMLFLLAAALIGDLIVLPALLASPLGKFFGDERLARNPTNDLGEPELRVIGDEEGQDEPEIHPDSLKHLDDRPDEPDIQIG